MAPGQLESTLLVSLMCGKNDDETAPSKSRKTKTESLLERNTLPLHGKREESDAATWSWGHLACRWCGWIGSRLWSRRRLQADGEMKTSRFCDSFVAQVPWQKAAARDHWARCGPHFRIGTAQGKQGERMEAKSCNPFPSQQRPRTRKKFHARSTI